MSYELARQMHMQQYGSFLHCPQRGNLCNEMGKTWETGTPCRRRPCILDDPDYQKLQERIEKNRIQAAAEAHRECTEEKTAAPIRDQRSYIKSYVEKQMEEIHRIEKLSQDAYRQNNPDWGDTLFNRARILRGELKKYEKEHQKRGGHYDQQSNRQDHGRDDEAEQPGRAEHRRALDQPLHKRRGGREAAGSGEVAG